MFRFVSICRLIAAPSRLPSARNSTPNLFAALDQQIAAIPQAKVSGSVKLDLYFPSGLNLSSLKTTLKGALLVKGG